MKYTMKPIKILAIGKFHNSLIKSCAVPANSLWVCVTSSVDTPGAAPTCTPKNTEAVNNKVNPIITQIVNCKIPAKEVPIIFPIIN